MHDNACYVKLENGRGSEARLPRSSPHRPDCSSQAAITASSMTSAFPFSRSATIIMCLAKRFGTENVSGNDWSSKSRKSNDARMTTWLSSSCRATRRPPVPPVEQAVAATLGDTVKLSGQAAEVGEPHQGMLACPTNVPAAAKGLWREHRRALRARPRNAHRFVHRRRPGMWKMLKTELFAICGFRVRTGLARTP